MKYITTIFLVLLLSTAPESQELPTVQMQTNFGIIVFELYPERAPLTVTNFINYAKDGFYDDTLFHRVIKNFVIQGGGYTTDYKRKPALRAPILNESNNELKNKRGTLSMARLFDDPDSGTSQFFINIVDNHFLDYQAILDEWGYTVFGNVLKGIEVVDAIQNVKTGAKGPFKKDTPLEPVIIVKVTVKGDINASSPPVTTFPVEKMAELISSYSANEKEDSYPADEIEKLTTSYYSADEIEEPIEEPTASEPANEKKEPITSKPANQTEKAVDSYPVDEMTKLIASYGEETETSVDENNGNDMANDTKDELTASDEEKAKTLADIADIADEETEADENWENEKDNEEDEAGDLAADDEEYEEYEENNEEKETIAQAEKSSKPTSEITVATTEKTTALENPVVAESTILTPKKLVQHYTLPPDKPSLPDKPMPLPY
jgi:cyclophilin family peptidyl-prolyl cis-trans isomerase